MSKIIEYLERYWHTKAVGCLAPVFGFIVSLTYFYSSQTQKIPIAGWAVSAVIAPDFPNKLHKLMLLTYNQAA